MLELDSSNYFSNEASKFYWSCSQLKDFAECPAKAKAKIDGTFEEKPSKAMLIGSFVDSYFSGDLEEFSGSNPEIFTRKGELRAEFKKAEEIVSRIEKDKLFMQYLSGEKQVIMTAKLFGYDFKCKLDSFIRDKAIVDLKIVKSIRDLIWDPKESRKVSFIELYKYDWQLAIYQKIVESNTGKKLPCYLAVADKGEETDLEIIYVDDARLELALAEIENVLPKAVSDKESASPIGCGICNFCKKNKVLKSPISYLELYN